ncbi:hypothetical protein QF010_000436 [Pseudomonas silensiensis]
MQIFETDEALLQSLAQETAFGVSKLQRLAFWGYNRAARKIDEWLKDGKIRQVESLPYRFVVCADPRPEAIADCQRTSKAPIKAGGGAFP